LHLYFLLISHCSLILHQKERFRNLESEICSLSNYKREFHFSVTDEVDVIGYTSNQSDSDDHSSVQSSSDSGVAMSTSRLTLSEMMDNL
jgi:MAX dimerization protein